MILDINVVLIKLVSPTTKFKFNIIFSLLSQNYLAYLILNIMLCILNINYY